jgi:hypothetical protein
MRGAGPGILNLQSAEVAGFAPISRGQCDLAGFGVVTRFGLLRRSGRIQGR